MGVYAVVQSFYNSGLGVEGKLGEYLEMSATDAGRIGKRYLYGVSRDVMDNLKTKRIKPRVIALKKVPGVVAPVKGKVVETAPNKMTRGAKNK